MLARFVLLWFGSFCPSGKTTVALSHQLSQAAVPESRTEVSWGRSTPVVREMDSGEKSQQLHESKRQHFPSGVTLTARP
jgi:hypothetical protein